jgi:DNA-binding CsgD family transcriptional regulator
MTEILERRSAPPRGTGPGQPRESSAVLVSYPGLPSYPGCPDPEPLDRIRTGEALFAETRGLPPRSGIHALIAYAVIGLAVVDDLGRTLGVAPGLAARRDTVTGTGPSTDAGADAAADPTRMAHQAPREPQTLPTGTKDAAAQDAAVTTLTARERDVLELVAQGLTNSDIARHLVLSQHTVHRHLTNIMRKLGLPSRAAAAVWGVRVGLV